MIHRPLLLGHRGCNRSWSTRKVPTENSLEAFEYALSQGCDGFEFDVRHTRDRQNVVWHDPQWDRKRIGYTAAASLQDCNGNRLATVEQVLQSFSHRAYLDIELKVPGNEVAVVAALKQTPPQRGSVISSFRPDILFRIRLLDSSMSLGFICDRGQAMSLWRELPVQVFLPQHEFVTRELISEVHASGVQLMTWTVNDAPTMRLLADWGIDGIVSDDPELLYQTFHAP